MPRAKSYADVLGDPSIPDTRPKIVTGPDAFDALDLNTKARILGPGKFALYQESGVPLEAFTQRHVSGTWGASRVARPLREIVADLTGNGWQPGDIVPTELAQRWLDESGPQRNYRPPVFVPPVGPAPTPPPVTKQPGEFESVDEVREWFAQEFPDLELHFDADVDIEAVNGSMYSLKMMKEQYPEGLAKMKAVRFRDFGPGNGNTYAHVANATMDSSGRWIDGNYSPSVDKDGYAVMAFNTTGPGGKAYGPKVQTVTRPLTAVEDMNLRLEMRTKSYLAELAEEFGVSRAEMDRMPAVEWYERVASKVSWSRRHYDQLQRTSDSLEVYIERMRFGDADAAEFRKYIALVDKYQTPFSPSGLTTDFKAWADARDKLAKGTITTEGDRPLWKILLGDMQSGFHPPVIDADGNDIMTQFRLNGSLTQDQRMRVMASIATHEYGHVYDISFWRKSRQYISDVTTTGSDWEVRVSAIWTDLVEKPMIGGAVSEYAKRNHFEKFAEAFSSMVHGDKKDWKPYTKKISAAIKALREIEKFDDRTPAAYGTNWDSLISRWVVVGKKIDFNRRVGSKYFDISKEEVRDWQEAKDLLRKWKNEGISASDAGAMLDDWRYERNRVKP